MRPTVPTKNRGALRGASSRQETALDDCRTCLWAKPRAGGECMTCFQYRRRHGVARPEHLIVAHAQRLLEQAGAR